MLSARKPEHLLSRAFGRGGESPRTGSACPRDRSIPNAARTFAAAVLFLVFAAFAPDAAPAVSPLPLDPTVEHLSLAPYLEILEEPSGKLTIREVSAPPMSARFRPLNAKVFDPGTTGSVWWLRFALRETPPVDSALLPETEWFIGTQRPFINSLRLYSPTPRNADGGADSGWTVAEAGDSAPRTDGNSLGQRPSFRIAASTDSVRTFYLRAEDPYTLFLPLEITSGITFLERSKLRILWFGIQAGVILALMVYNVFLFISLRDRSYLWYIWYVAFLSLYLHSIGGLISEFLPVANPGLGLDLTFSCLGLACVGAGMFARSFLLTPQNAPSMDRALILFIAASGALAAAEWFLPAGPVNTAWSLLGAALFIAIIVSGLICWWRGFQPARYFLLAMTLLVLCGLNYDLAINGIRPFTVWTFYAFQLGSALEAILLSFALADRIKSLQRLRRGAILNERHLRELADTDGLTGLYNARYFHDRLAHETVQAERRGIPLALLMLDIDNFKRFNDTWGHPEGDRVLSCLGRIIASQIRESDIACRYGGEEFAVILRGSGDTLAVVAAERIRTAVATERFIPGGINRPEVTVCIGTAEHVPGREHLDLLTRADQALYRAKHGGKNRVVRADAEVWNQEKRKGQRTGSRGN